MGMPYDLSSYSSLHLEVVKMHMLLYLYVAGFMRPNNEQLM